MVDCLSTTVKRLSPSATFVMAQKSSELLAQGIDIVNLSVGEPDFETPANIKEAAHVAINNNFTKYSAVSGYTSLKESIRGKLLRENGLEYESSEIVISNGAKQSICNAVLSLVSPGDEVIIPSPYWVSYPQMVMMANGTPVPIETTLEDNFKIDAERLDAAITERTKLIILNTPSNPTGAVYSTDDLESIAKVILNHKNVFVISDEIYEHINYVGKHSSIANIPGMKERTVVVNGVSKAYAMTGWRIGYIAAPKWIASACNMLQGQYTSGPCSISQKAAEEALNGSQESVELMRQMFQNRRDLIVKLISEIPGIEVMRPDGAFYLFPKCSAYFGRHYGEIVIESSTDLALYLLEQGHVATVAGDAFGAREYLRLSYATSEENITKGVEKIREALELLV